MLVIHPQLTFIRYSVHFAFQHVNNNKGIQPNKEGGIYGENGKIINNHLESN